MHPGSQHQRVPDRSGPERGKSNLSSGSQAVLTTCYSCPYTSTYTHTHTCAYTKHPVEPQIHVRSPHRCVFSPVCTQMSIVCFTFIYVSVLSFSCVFSSTRSTPSCPHHYGQRMRIHQQVRSSAMIVSCHHHHRGMSCLVMYGCYVMLHLISCSCTCDVPADVDVARLCSVSLHVYIC